MKTAIIGYGKMGREIEKILTERGHIVSLIIDAENRSDLDARHLADVDVALEFTTPATAYDNIRTCIACNTPVVSGTWRLCVAKRTAHFSMRRISVWASICCSGSTSVWPK